MACYASGLYSIPGGDSDLTNSKWGPTAHNFSYQADMTGILLNRTQNRIPSICPPN